VNIWGAKEPQCTLVRSNEALSMPALTKLPKWREAATSQEHVQKDIVRLTGPFVKKPVKLKLPPGWREVWSQKEMRNYYADVERGESQREPLEPYVHQHWERRLDSQHRRYWCCEELCAFFYEGDDRRQRYVARDVYYWSRLDDPALRFFEELPPVAHRGPAGNVLARSYHLRWAGVGPPRLCFSRLDFVCRPGNPTLENAAPARRVCDSRVASCWCTVSDF